MREAEERDAVEMSARLSVWDDDESDETFYVDRSVSEVVSSVTLLM